MKIRTQHSKLRRIEDASARVTLMVSTTVVGIFCLLHFWLMSPLKRNLKIHVYNKTHYFY